VLIVAAVLGLIGGWQWYRLHQGAAVVLWVLAGGVLICAFVPPAAKRFHHYWMALAAVLGYVNSRILLSAIYYLLITPIGTALRLTGYDPLRRRGSRRVSYWVQRERTRQTPESFERAF
jgi:hypothetical protein